MATQKRSQPEGQEVPLATHMRDQLYLYAFATQREVNQYVRTQIAKSGNESPEAILAKWRKVQSKVETILNTEQGLANILDQEELDPKDHKVLKDLVESPLFAKSYFATSVRFAMVDVDHMVAPQRHVNLDHVEKIQQKAPKNASLERLIEFCLTPSAGIEDVQHKEVGRDFHIFSSVSSDLRFLGSYMKELAPGDVEYAEHGGMPAAALIAFVGYGASEVNALGVGGRIILNNGFHRVYALRAMGYKRLPVLIQEIKNPALEMGGNIMGIASNYLANHPRPVLLKDFFNPDLVLKFRVPKTVKTVKVRVMTESYDIPV